MNQPQPLCTNFDFQGFLVCQIPKDTVKVELKIKTKWGKFTLHTDEFTRTEKYRAWKKVNCCRIHSRRRQPNPDRTGESHLNVSTESGTFINSGHRMGYPPKIFVDSDSDDDIPPHIEDYCRTCLTKWVKCSCKPMSDWSVELIDITQLDLPNPDNNKDRDDEQDQALPSDWTDQDNFWSGKTYDKVRPLSSLKPVPAQPPSKGDEDSEWSKHLHPHNYRAKAPSQASPSKPQPGWPKGIRTNPTVHQVTSSPTKY